MLISRLVLVFFSTHAQISCSPHKTLECLRQFRKQRVVESACWITIRFNHQISSFPMFYCWPRPSVWPEPPLPGLWPAHFWPDKIWRAHSNTSNTKHIHENLSEVSTNFQWTSKRSCPLTFKTSSMPPGSQLPKFAFETLQPLRTLEPPDYGMSSR